MHDWPWDFWRYYLACCLVAGAIVAVSLLGFASIREAQVVAPREYRTSVGALPVGDPLRVALCGEGE